MPNAQSLSTENFPAIPFLLEWFEKLVDQVGCATTHWDR